MRPTLMLSDTDLSPVARYIDDVTIVIKTFERPDCLRALLLSLRLYYPEVPVIIIDDSRIALEQSMFDAHTRYVHTEFDIGLSEGRNRGVALADTEFVFIADDDIIFTPLSRLERLKLPLVEAKFDISASRLFNYGKDEVMYYGLMKRTEKVLNLFFEEFRGHKDGYPVYDFCLNVFMAGREFLLENGWALELKLQEHWKFFYRIKQKASGLVTIQHDTVFDHMPVRPSAYAPFRRNHSRYQKLGLSMHGFERVEQVLSPRQRLFALATGRKKRRGVIGRMVASIRR